MYERSYGYLYDEASGDAAEIAKRMRADIRTAQTEGLLPVGPTYSVTIERFSGGQSVDVEVRDFPNAWKRCDRLTCPNAWCRSGGIHRDLEAASDHDILTDEAEAAAVTLKRIHEAYNHDGSDIMTDYFDVRYYGHVRFESIDDAAFRAKEATRKAAWRAALDTATDRRTVAVFKRQGPRVVHIAVEVDGKVRLLCGAVARAWSMTFVEASITCSRCAKRSAALSSAGVR